MSDRDRMAAALFDAVGQIDDVFVAEAIGYKRIIKRKSLIKRISAIAAAVLLVIAISVPAFIGIKNILSSFKNSFVAEPEKALTLQAGEKLGSGISALIWQRSGQTDYSYVEISGTKARTLVEEISSVPVGSRAETDVRVWIKLDNGEYISPQLQKSAGNTGLDLFEFSPELELSDTIAYIINNSESGNPK